MSEMQRQPMHSSKILLVTGSLCALFGLFMFAQREGFAGFFLGARFLFGMPLTSADVFKVLLFSVSSVITTLMGIVIVAVGVALSLKSSAAPAGAPQGNPATPAPR